MGVTRQKLTVPAGKQPRRTGLERRQMSCEYGLEAGSVPRRVRKYGQKIPRVRRCRTHTPCLCGTPVRVRHSVRERVVADSGTRGACPRTSVSWVPRGASLRVRRKLQELIPRGRLWCL